MDAVSEDMKGAGVRGEDAEDQVSRRKLIGEKN